MLRLTFLVYLCIAVQPNTTEGFDSQSHTDKALLTIFDDVYDALSSRKTIEVTTEQNSARGQANGPPETPNEFAPPVNAPAPAQPPFEPHNYAPFPAPSPFSYQTYGENPISYPPYPSPSPFPYARNPENFPGNGYPGPYPPRDYNGRRNFRPPRYEYRPHYHDQYSGNGSDPFPRQPYQYRGRRPFNRYEGDNFNASRYDRQNDTHKGNYAPTFNNDYYDSASPYQQYYQDPSYNQQYNAPPFGEHPYAYPRQQYYYPPSAVADPYNGPQYGQPSYDYQQQYGQPGPSYGQPSSLNSSNTLQSSSSKKDRRGRKKKTESTPSLSNDQTNVNSSPQPQSNFPQQWNANYPVPPGPQQQGGSYYAPPPHGSQNQYPPQQYPIYGQPYNNWPPQHMQYSQPSQNQRKVHNIDFQGLDLNYDPEGTNDLLQPESPSTQTGRYHPVKNMGRKMSKRRMTEQNYNTFSSKELRERTRNGSDFVNYNTYSDQELKEMQSVTGLVTLPPEYGDYNSSELLEDSEETRNYNTWEPTNATKHPTKEINYNTLDPKELKKVRTSPDSINYNTHGNRPYLHTDPYNSETLYKEYQRGKSVKMPRSYHTPNPRHRKYFATAKPLNFETLTTTSIGHHTLYDRHRKYFEAKRLNFEIPTLASSIGEKHKQQGRGRLSECLDNMMSPESTTFLEDDPSSKNSSESLFNHWLFGENRSDQKNNSTSTSLSPTPFTLERRSRGRSRTIPSDYEYQSLYPPPLMGENRLFGYRRGQNMNFEQESPYPPPLMPEHRMFGYRRSQSAQPPSTFNYQSFYTSSLMPSAQPRSTFDRRAFFASESTTEHWLLTGRKLSSKVSSTQSVVRKVSDSSTASSDYESIPWLPPLYVPSSSSTRDSTVSSLNPSRPSSSSKTTTSIETTMPSPTPATPSSSSDGTPHIKNHHHHSHHSHSSSSIDTTMPSPTPATPSSSSDGTPHIKNHHHRSHHGHHKDHEHSSSVRSHHSSLTKSSGSHHAKDHHSTSHSHHNHHHHHHHHHHHEDTSPSRRKRDTEDISSSSEDDSSSRSDSNPLDVSNAKEYCAWMNQQRYLQSIERRKIEDRKHQKFSPPPLLKEMEFRSVNPEYQQTPYWTGSTSYVWLPGGKKKKVIDLPDESYGLLIEDSEEWWQAQKREAKRLRAIKDLGINVEGERKHNQYTHEKEKKSKIGKVFRFVKSIFGFGNKKKADDDLKSEPSVRKPADQNSWEDDGDRRGWNKFDKRFQRPRNFQDRNFNKPNFRNYPNNPEQGYQPRYRNYPGGPGGPPPYDHQGGPGGPPENHRYPPNFNPNYHRNPNFNGPGAGDQKNSKPFNYKPYHENYNHPDNPDNKPKHKQDDKPTVQGAAVDPCNTRSPDSDPKGTT